MSDESDVYVGYLLMSAVSPENKEDGCGPTEFGDALRFRGSESTLCEVPLQLI